MSHNNLHVGSVFVSEDGSWRLGDMGYATRFAETTMTALSATRDYRHPDTVTPEERVTQAFICLTLTVYSKIC